MISMHGDITSRIDHMDSRYQQLVQANERLGRKDATLWGPEAQQEAQIRLNWIDLPSTSRELLPELDALSARYRHCTRVILCGMGGSSLAPEVIAATYNKEIFILDSTDPTYLSHALLGDFSHTVIVVSSKSGGTIETASARALFETHLLALGLVPQEHMVIVTDPGSPLDIDARSRQFIVINADPHVGGRFSALSAFGLVPAALIGIDVSVLLDSAYDALEQLKGEHSPAVGAAYLMAHCSGQYISFSDSQSGMPGLSDWIEQLVAESTGKNQVGRLPVAIEESNAPVSGDALRIAFNGNADLVVEGDLGAQFIFWEWTTALIGVALAIDPYNQPNVTEAKNQTSALLQLWSGKLPVLTCNAHDGSVEIFSKETTVQDTLMAIIDSVSSDGYISVMAYLDRLKDAQLAQIRRVLADKSGRPVTFGWGPRFLHSTGQFHKGGQQNGIFLQITGETENDIAIPGKDFSFHTLIMAQALGDAQALESRGFTVMRLHITNRADGVAEILAASRSIV